jgi:hypothetical protein
VKLEERIFRTLVNEILLVFQDLRPYNRPKSVMASAWVTVKISGLIRNLSDHLLATKFRHVIKGERIMKAYGLQ